MKTIQIKGPIVPDDVGMLYQYFGLKACSPDAVRKGLEEAGGEDVVLEINSMGGVCVSAYEIYTDIRKYEGNVEAQIVCAMSAATVIACAADKAYISPTGIYMIHNAQIPRTGGNHRDLEEQADALRQIDEGIINAYVLRTGKERSEIEYLMECSTYMAPERAINLGFVDGLMFEEENEEARRNAVALASDWIIQEDKAQEILLALGLGSGAKPPNRHMEGLFGQEVGEDMQDGTPETAAKPPNRHMEGLFGQEPPNEGRKSEQSRQTGTWRGSSEQEEQMENRKEENKMGLEELLEKYPEARQKLEEKIEEEVNSRVNEAREQGAADERARIRSLDEIAGQVSAEALYGAKYGDKPTDGPTLAFRTLAEGKRIAAGYMAQAIADAGASGTDQVGIRPSEEGSAADESDAMADFVNRKRGKGYENAE